MINSQLQQLFAPQAPITSVAVPGLQQAQAPALIGGAPAAGKSSEGGGSDVMSMIKKLLGNGGSAGASGGDAASAADLAQFAGLF